MPVIDPNVPGQRPDPDVLLPPEVLREVTAAVADAAGEQCADLFAAAMRRTLERTLHVLPDGTVFVITGDIPAMWLRDSATQMRPYVKLLASAHSSNAAVRSLSLSKGDLEPLADLIEGVVRRQFRFIAANPYANAFNAAPNGNCHEPRDLCEDELVWEQKYEIDSLCFPFQLAEQLAAATGRTTQFDDAFDEAVFCATSVLSAERDHERNSAYRFVRPAPKGLGLAAKAVPSIWRDTLPRDGLGSPVAVTGMTWSGFRPSDDACEYGYLVPANLMAAHTLDLIAVRGRATPNDSGSWARDENTGLIVEELTQRWETLGGILRDGVAEHGVVEHPEHGEIWAYEVDGLGNVLLADDANMPSLLSLPLVSDVTVDDPLYRRTREFVLSPDNPYFVSGRLAAGPGSPHTPHGYVWPIALAVAGLTTDDPAQALEYLQTIARTTAGTGYVHESFDVNDDHRFTRDWFSWADSMYCELALTVAGY